MPHLPSRPEEQDNLLGQLLVDPGTANELCWSLMDKVDPHSKTKGKPLLLVFCEQRNNDKQLWTDLSFLENPLPLSPGQSWPDPRARSHGKTSKGWPTPDMWVAAHLICNGPDPFSWKDARTGKDVLDFAIRWNNPLLLDQLLRHPSAPNQEDLAKRSFAEGSLPWLHALSRMDMGQMVAVLLHHGFDANQLDRKGATALHHAAGVEVVSALLDKGADPFACDKASRGILQSWVSNAYPSERLYRSIDHEIDKKFELLDVAATKKNATLACQVSVSAAFDAMVAGKTRTIATQVAARHDLPLDSWFRQEGNSKESLVCAMSIASLQKKKSPLVPRICGLLADLPDAALHYSSRRKIPDLGWAWLAIARYGDNSSDGVQYRQKLIERLSHNQSPSAATKQLWRSAFHFDGAKPFKGSKVDNAIRQAWTNELNELGRELASDKSLNPKVHRFDALMEDPLLLPYLARMPTKGISSHLDLVRIIENVYKHDAALGPVCLLSAAAMCQSHQPSNESDTLSVRAMEKLINSGVQWDGNLPGAQATLDALVDRSRSTTNEELKRITSHIQALRLDSFTPPAFARARQRF